MGTGECNPDQRILQESLELISPTSLEVINDRVTKRGCSEQRTLISHPKPTEHAKEFAIHLRLVKEWVSTSVDPGRAAERLRSDCSARGRLLLADQSSRHSIDVDLAVVLFSRIPDDLV